MAAAREVTALRSTGTPGGSGHASPTAAMIAASAAASRDSLAEMVATHAKLFRQGSMNLPRPEDSGVPATHPDMCILRIRRQHLLEVRIPLDDCHDGKRHFPHLPLPVAPPRCPCLLPDCSADMTAAEFCAHGSGLVLAAKTLAYVLSNKTEEVAQVETIRLIIA